MSYSAFLHVTCIAIRLASEGVGNDLHPRRRYQIQMSVAGHLILVQGLIT
jgi:hypothetical protein